MYKYLVRWPNNYEGKAFTLQGALDMISLKGYSNGGMPKLFKLEEVLYSIPENSSKQMNNDDNDRLSPFNFST